MRLPPPEVAHPSEEEFLHEVVQQIALVPVVEERASHESTELGQRGAERLRRARRTAQHRECAEKMLRCVVEVFEDGIEHVALCLDRSGVEAARGEELEGERMASGGGDHPGHV